MDLHVDLATRNLVLNDTDESMAGPGQSLTVRRTYNSRNVTDGLAGAYGPGWNLNGGVDAGISINRAQVNLFQPSGAIAWFTRHFEQSATSIRQRDNDANGPSWYASGGINADLVKDDSTHYRVIWRENHTEATFTLPTASSTTGYLSKLDDGRGNSIIYTSSGSPLQTTQITDATGQRSVNLTYTSGVVTGMTESLASGASGTRSWTYGYTAGNLTTYVDPAGKTTRYCYTSNLLTKIITPRGTASGAACSTTQGTDVTDISYDSTGKVTSVTYENGTAAAITVTFATPNDLGPGATSGTATSTDPYGKTTTYVYDVYDRTTRLTTPMNYPSTKSFNTNNDVTASVDASNYTGNASDPSTTATYDAFNNMTNMTTPGQVAINATYTDAANPYQPDKVSDDRDGSTSSSMADDYNRNSTGQITAASKGAATSYVRHQGDSGVSNCGPDRPLRRPIRAQCARLVIRCMTARTPLNIGMLYRYNSLGEQTSMTPPQPDHGRTTPPAWSYTYDSHSRLSTQTDSRGKTTSYTYDALDRLTRITYDAGRYTSYTYDDDGDRLTTSDRTSANVVIAGTTRTWTYDNFNRTSTDKQAGYGPITTMTWDANSRLLTIDDGSGVGPVGYGYNADGGLTSMTEPGGNCTGYSETNLPPTGSGCIIFQVDKNRRRLHTWYPGNVASEQLIRGADGKIGGLEADGQDGSGSTTFFHFVYDYNFGTQQTNHVATRHQTAGSGSRVEYAYTGAGKLTAAKQYDNPVSGGTNTNLSLYCYDSIGNLTDSSTTVGASCTSPVASYDGANQELGTNHGYDLDGDETTNTSTTPTSGTIRTSTWTDSQQLASVTLNGTTTLSNTYTGPTNDQLLTADTSSTGQDQLRYNNLGIGEVKHTEVGNPTKILYADRDPDGTLVALRSSAGTLYFPLTDAQNSIYRIVDSSGIAVDTYYYDPYGALTTNSGTLMQPFAYLGAYRNAGTGLQHLGARFYDATNAAFTQPDPQAHLTDPTQAGQYPYAGDDPVNETDRTGQDFLDDVGDFLADSAGVVFGIGVSEFLGPVIGGFAGVALADSLKYDFSEDSAG